MNRDLIELREVIGKLVPMLAGKGLRVTQIGKKAYVQTDTRTRKPVLVNIPMIPDNAEQGFIEAVQGFVDHEIGHVLCTDWNYYGGAPTAEELRDPKVQAFQNTHNIVEDTMIEKEVVRIFPGAEKNIARLRRHFIEKITKPALATAKSPKEEFAYLLVPVMRALSGHQEFQDFMDAEGYWKHPFVQHLTSQLSKDFLDNLKAARTTKETLDLARELHAILYPPPPPPPPTAAETGDMAAAISEPQDDEDGESEDKPEKEAGEGDGDGERDHSESEGEEGDEEEPGACGAKPEEDEGEDEADAGESGAGEGEEEDEKDEEKPAAGKVGDDFEDEDEPGEDQDDEGEPGAGKDDEGDEEAPDSKGEQDDDDDADDGEDDAGEPGEDGAGSGEEPDEGDAEGASSGEDGDDEDDEDSAGGGSDAGDDETDEEDGAGGGAGGEPGDDEDAGSTSGGEVDDGVTSKNENPEDAKLKDDEPKGGGELRGVGTASSKSMFDFTDDAFEKADMSSAFQQIISETIEGMLEDRSLYLPLTRDLDEIAPLPVPEKMNSTWVPKMDEEVMHMVGRMQKDIERAMASQSHVHYTPGHKTGKLHGPSLFRISQGDPRVFRQKEEHISKETAVTLLIDNSGSMHGQKMRLAMLSGYAFAATLDRVKIVHEILGFTTGHRANVPQAVRDAIAREFEGRSRWGTVYDRSEPIVMPIYKDFEERLSPLVKQRIAYAMNAQNGLAGNIDGESVEYAAMRLLKRKEKRKVLIVLSDGQPAGGRLCQPHLRSVINDCETKYGIETIGIGIMDSSVKRFYPKHVVLNDVEELPNQVMTEIKKLLL